MYKQHYRRFLDGHPGWLHFAAHSHYFWPDVTREAVLECWDDASRLSDRKWDHLFSTILPKAQRHVARRIGVDRESQIVFTPNTHEFVARLFSCFDPHRPSRILTTDSEFHSFRRQLQRWKDAKLVEVTTVAAEPVATFEARFAAAAAGNDFDMIFFSHVFFSSGYAIQNLNSLLDQISGQAEMVVVDGYHSFCALPVDISRHADRVFYLGGGYKYAQSGEGVCFLYVPEGCQLKPRNTGWFAGFSTLEDAMGEEITYPDDGTRFAGATFDFAGLYRFNAVMDLLDRLKLDPVQLHRTIQALQQQFLDSAARCGHTFLSEGELLFEQQPLHGHFFTYQMDSAGTARSVAEKLAAEKVYIDYRGSRIRFGFGLYQDADDIEQLFERIKRASKR